MRSLIIQLVGVAAFAAFAAGPAAAQCSHLTGNPAPVPELLASKVRLRAAGGGVWSDGNDKFKILKGSFSPAVAIDPVTAHTFHFTLRHIDASGLPVILTFTIPPGAPWVSLGGGKFRYNDGSIKIKMRDFGGLVAYKVSGRNANIVFPPVVSGDTAHLMLEMEEAGVGHCGEWNAFFCSATATKADCF